MFFLQMILAFVSSTVVTGSCYWPDGTDYSTGLEVCDMSSEHSHCCYSQDACLNNGYCLNQNPSGWSQYGPGGYGNRLVRVGCTDSTWQSDACKNFLQ